MFIMIYIYVTEIPVPPSAYTTTQKTILDNQTIRKKGKLTFNKILVVLFI